MNENIDKIVLNMKNIEIQLQFSEESVWKRLFFG